LELLLAAHSEHDGRLFGLVIDHGRQIYRRSHINQFLQMKMFTNNIYNNAQVVGRPITSVMERNYVHRWLLATTNHTHCKFATNFFFEGKVCNQLERYALNRLVSVWRKASLTLKQASTIVN
jgi:hypothetical protein